MIYAAILIIILAADILTKLWAAGYLRAVGSIPLIKGVFQLTYVENRGAAFGMFQGARIFFIAVTVILIVAAVYFIPRLRGRSRTFDFGAVFVLAGALGNLIDRIFRGFVVDFLDFCLIDFPVFNIADIFVCVGAFLIFLYIIFFDESGKKDSEHNDL